jgi:hypothetical protein
VFFTFLHLTTKRTIKNRIAEIEEKKKKMLWYKVSFRGKSRLLAKIENKGNDKATLGAISFGLIAIVVLCVCLVIRNL